MGLIELMLRQRLSFLAHSKTLSLIDREWSIEDREADDLGDRMMGTVFDALSSVEAGPF